MKFFQDMYDDVIQGLIDNGTINESNVEKFSENIKDINHGIIEKTSEILAEDLLKGASALLKSEISEELDYSREVVSKWKDPLSLLEAIIKISQEILTEIADENKGEELEHQTYFTLVLKLQSKCIVLAKEIRILLIFGYAEGALAKWRSLHETNVILHLITSNKSDMEFTNNLIQRYLDYSVIDDVREIKAYERSGNLNVDEEYKQQMLCLQNKVLKKYGRDFKKQNMWAKPLFPTKENIFFSDLEEKVKLNTLNQYYNQANIHVHTGSKGLMNGMALNDFTDENQLNFFMLTGAEFGLSIPIQLTAISLMQATVEVLTSLNKKLDDPIMSYVLLRFVDECKEACQIVEGE